MMTMKNKISITTPNLNDFRENQVVTTASFSQNQLATTPITELSHRYSSFSVGCRVYFSVGFGSLSRQRQVSLDRKKYPPFVLDL